MIENENDGRYGISKNGHDFQSHSTTHEFLRNDTQYTKAFAGTDFRPSWAHPKIGFVLVEALRLLMKIQLHWLLRNFAKKC